MGTSASVFHSKLSSVPYDLRLFLFKFIRLPPLDFAFAKTVGLVLCSISSNLTWRKLHVKFRSRWAAESNCHASLGARHNSGYIGALAA